MEIITQNLLNLEWWGKAIIASLIAGYIKGWIPKFASGVSKAMKTRREKRIESDALLVSRIQADPTVAAVYGIKLIVDGGMGGLGLVLGTTLPMITHFYRSHPELDFGVTLHPVTSSL